MTVTATEVNVDGVFVVDDTTDAGHRSVNGLLLLNEGPLLQRFRQWARVGQVGYLVYGEVTNTCSQSSDRLTICYIVLYIKLSQTKSEHFALQVAHTL